MRNSHRNSHAVAPPPLPKANFALQPHKWQGASVDEILSQRRQHLSAGQYHFYKVPLMLVEASMQYCFDEKGQQYVDGYSNVCHVGHCHPYFVRSCERAMQNIISNTRYLHPSIGKYAEKLKSVLPSSLSVCYFVNSGSEANDLAMRLARVYTGKKKMLCLEHAYHGTTQSCTGVSTSLSVGTTSGASDYKYCSGDVETVPVPDVYRGKYKGDDRRAGEKYARYVQEKTRGGDIAAFIHESVQGVGGQIVYPIDYLQQAYAHTRAEGGITIADEVQTGFGRTGTHFWAFEAQNVVPDILTLGKPIGNGFPLGAVICTREIARAFDGVQYFNTNGGNPVACAAGLAVLEIIERDQLQQNALTVSAHLMPKLEGLKRKHDIIGDVRGVGLFLGIELVRDRGTLEPAVEETAAVMEQCRDHGLLIGKGGARGNVLRMKPPLCFTIEDADFMVATLDAVIGGLDHGAHRRVGARRSAAAANDDDDAPSSYINCVSQPRKRGAANGAVARRLVESSDSSDGERRRYERRQRTQQSPAQKRGSGPRRSAGDAYRLRDDRSASPARRDADDSASSSSSSEDDRQQYARELRNKHQSRPSGQRRQSGQSGGKRRAQSPSSGSDSDSGSDASRGGRSSEEDLSLAGDRDLSPLASKAMRRVPSALRNIVGRHQ
jgi:4-aminobutyrate aminotransferase-like enzyme